MFMIMDAPYFFSSDFYVSIFVERNLRVCYMARHNYYMRFYILRYSTNHIVMDSYVNPFFKPIEFV